MIKITQHIVLLFFVSVISICAQANDKKFGISFNINYTSTSQLFLQPKAVDPFIRNTHENLDKITSYSIDLRYQFSESIIVGIGSELIEKTFENSINLGGIRAKMNDGYKMTPLEISGYYLIPFSSEHFKFFFGGGFGLYFGNHIRNFGDVTIENENSKIGYGMHVAVGMDYVIYNFISVRGQIRFRDPEFETTNRYSSQTVNYNNQQYVLSSQTFNSKVNIDGITFTLGMVLNF
ncbi:hypothetical protein C0389_03670 [bacterium]|nr:hypothetical protein [bacterium]